MNTVEINNFPLFYFILEAISNTNIHINLALSFREFNIHLTNKVINKIEKERYLMPIN